MEWSPAVGVIASILWLAGPAACSSPSDGTGGAAGTGGSSGATDGGPSLLDVLLRHNELTVAGLELRCALCGCSGISGGAPEGRVCMDRVIREKHPDLVEPMRAYYECLIPLAEQKRACYESAADCPAAEACSPAVAPREEACAPAVLASDAATALGTDLQSECGG